MEERYLRFHYGVVAQLDVDPACAFIQPCLGHLHGVLLVLDRLTQQVDVALHIEDLLHSLKSERDRFIQYTAPLWS